MILFLFIIIEICIYGILFPVDVIQEYLFILFNAVFVLLFIHKQYQKYEKILFIAYFLRITLLIIDYNSIFYVIHSNSDTEMFHYTALINYKHNDYGIVHTNYSLWLTWLYMRLGECRLIAQYFNVVCGMGVLLYLCKIFDLLALGERQKKRLLLLSAIFPHLIIFSSVLLREAWCEFFITVSVYYFLLWMKKSGLRYAVLSIIFLLPAAGMHAGCILLVLGYIIAFVCYYPKLQKTKITAGAVLMIVILFSGFVSMLLFTDIFADKLNIGSVDLANDGLYKNTESTFRAESAYLTWINPDSSAQLLLFSPLKMFYFLFSPVPIDWRGMGDMVAFFTDSVCYFCLIYVIITNYRKLQNRENKHIIKYLFLSLFIIWFVFAYGTVATGTAMRHRAKLFPICLTIYAVSIVGKKEKKSQRYYTQKI